MAAGDSGVEPETPPVSSDWEEASVIEGRVTLTVADFTSAVANKSSSNRPFLLPVAGFLALAVWNALERVALGTTVALGGVFVLFLFVQVRKRKTWASRLANTLARGVTIFRFDEQGFSMQFEQGMQSGSLEHRMTWASLVGHGETPESFLVYMAPKAFVVVPKRAFQTSELVVIREWLGSRVLSTRAAANAAADRRKLLAWVAALVAALSVWHLLRNDHARKTGARKARSVRIE